MTDAAVASAQGSDGKAAVAATGSDAAARSAMLSDDAGGAASGASDGGATQGQGHNSGGGFDKNGDWRAGFVDGLDDATKETWGKLSSRYTSQADMAKAHVNLVQTMDKRIAIPGPDAKPEEVDAVFAKLGMPETADKYQFNIPADAPWDDGRKSQIKELAPLFRQARATQAQVDMFVKQQAELDKVAQDAAIAQANTLSQQRLRQMQTEWKGDDFKRNKSLVAMTVKTYAGGDTDEIAGLRLADGTFAVDHPAFARMFAKIGAERSEDDRDPSGFNAGARENVKSEIDRIEAEAAEKGLTPSSRNYPHGKLEPLYAKLHGKRNDYGAMSNTR